MPYRLLKGTGVAVREKWVIRNIRQKKFQQWFLVKIKADAKRLFLGVEKVTEAVITVRRLTLTITSKPWRLTKDAVKIAGLEVKRIINEPTAAAFVAGLEKGKNSETIVVFDLGVRLTCRYWNSLTPCLEVKATNGDTHTLVVRMRQRYWPTISWTTSNQRKNWSS